MGMFYGKDEDEVLDFEVVGNRGCWRPNMT